MKRFLFPLFLLLSVGAFGKIWIVDSNVGSTSKDFTDLQSAHVGAAAGDTLYMIGSPTNYITAKVTITKRLVIIGPGYFLSENPDTQANILTAFLNNASPGVCEELEFAPGSEGSVLMGVDIIGRIVINANNILVKRNHIYQETGCNLSTVSITASSVFFVQNFIVGVLSTGLPLILVNGSQSNLLFANNYLYHFCFAACSSNAISAAGSSLEFSNNVVTGGIIVSTALIQNNIFIFNASFSAPASTVRNNLQVVSGGSTPLPAGNGNINGVVMANLFAGPGTTDGQWQLKPGSPALGAGFGGTDAGMFGGTEPYVLSGIPPVPAIYGFTAPLVGDKVNGLPVQIKVKSRN